MTFESSLSKIVIMTNQHFSLDSRLLTDSHALFDWQHCHLRLHKNASLPWVIIIPRTDEIEYCDLPIERQLEISQLGRVIGHYFKQYHGSEKINFAAIGNVVQQLHVHVIGRNRKDPVWPDVVWGRELPDKSYSQQQLDDFKLKLQQAIESHQN